MRLEKIALEGFKSFADRTELTFETAITAIVGPNGCGKSNIVDAVKWVLGEQSVKSLRSGQMADVIFSGSSSKKPAASAEVSLYISKTTGQLPIEADEVRISRRIYKSGESEYRINNKLCRLKDIRELFMDTGIGVSAYSIIEQGQVERLLNASRSERRVIFEEAAGISKYKAHKKEALRKLERTSQNLLRLADILGEVQKQLRSVKLAAGKARNYLQYTERLKELQINYSLAEFDKLKKQTREKTSRLEVLERLVAESMAEVARYDSGLSNIGREIIETENRINSTDNRLVTVKSKIEQQLQKIEFLKSRQAELQQRTGESRERLDRLNRQRSGLDDELANYLSEQAECESTLTKQSETSRTLQDNINKINLECEILQSSLDDEKSGVIDIVRRTAQLHNELLSINDYRSNLSGQKERLRSRADSSKAELEQLLAEKAGHKVRLGDIEKVLGELEQNHESKKQQQEQASIQIETLSEQLSEKRQEKSTLDGELAVLLDIESKKEGLSKSVKKILEVKLTGDGKYDYIDGLLAEIISTDVEHAFAVEAALEGKTECLIVSDSSRLLADKQTIEGLEERVEFICADRTGPFKDSLDISKHSQIKARAVELVRTEGKYAALIWQLLGRTLLVDSIESAIELADKLPACYQFVTVQGELLDSDGVIKLGPPNKRTGLISRKSRLSKLQQKTAELDGQIAELQEQLQKNNQKNEHLDELCGQLRTAIYEARTENMQVSSKLASLEQQIQRLSEEQPLICGEIEMLETQISESVQKEYESKQKLEELESINSQRTERITSLEQQYQHNKQQQELMNRQLTELKVSLGQAGEQSRALKQAISSIHNQLNDNQSTIQAGESEIVSCRQQYEDAQRQILGCESAVSELYVEKEKTQHSSSELHQQIEELIEQQKRTEELIRSKRSELSGHEQNISDVKVELGQFDVKRQTLKEQVQQELGMDIETSYENYTESEIDWESVREEIYALRGKIERLGNVNLDAISEQEGLEQRSEFLTRQVEDLNKSKSQLQQLIGRLNKTSREKFLQTFEDIRMHFQQIFRKLFGGGKADIILEDSQDVLEAGIEIIARPPGKQTRSISLLSGGEKAMTAIALLFAVFKTKPSPFCFLDEIDAALDEANNERFNQLVREFQKDSQFIIITHAKRTMSIADMLYGITMQTRGVSKKISVRFDQYEAEAETAAVA